VRSKRSGSASRMARHTASASASLTRAARRRRCE
jgi:hypothetical protein